jgi:hypothetical protein
MPPSGDAVVVQAQLRQMLADLEARAWSLDGAADRMP